MGRYRTESGGTRDLGVGVSPEGYPKSKTLA